MQKQQFRLDLYYRLNVLPIRLPSLREREGDVRRLLQFFLDCMNRMNTDRAPSFFREEVIEHLTQYSWPGNVRQLKNLVERLVIIGGGGPISLHDLPPEYFEDRLDRSQSLQSHGEFEPFTGSARLDHNTVTKNVPTELGVPRFSDNPYLLKLPEEGIALTDVVTAIENDLIVQALERTTYNKNRAAKLLGLNRTTLVERIKKRGLDKQLGEQKELFAP